MKNAKKRLLISAMVLISTIVLATSTTLAWFTMDNTPSVEGFDVNVTTQDGLYVSLVPFGSTESGDDYVDYIVDGKTATKGRAGTFKSYLTKEEVEMALLLYNEAGNSYEDTKNGDALTLKALTHATTENGTSFTIPSGVVGVREGVEETTHVTFRLYFYSNSEYKVSLKVTESADLTGDTSYSNVTSTAGSAPKTKAWIGNTLGLAVGADVDAEAANAVRIAFDSGSGIKFWEPNKDKGFTASGKNAALEYYNFVNKVSLTAGTPVTTSTNLELLTLTADSGGYSGYLDITIWLEGHDFDAFNTILTHKITTALAFEGTVVAV